MAGTASGRQALGVSPGADLFCLSWGPGSAQPGDGCRHQASAVPGRDRFGAHARDSGCAARRRGAAGEGSPSGCSVAKFGSGCRPRLGRRGVLSGLRGLGWVEGQNIAIERRYAEERFERFPSLAAELVRLKVDVILPGAGPASLKAARRRPRPSRS